MATCEDFPSSIDAASAAGCKRALKLRSAAYAETLAASRFLRGDFSCVLLLAMNCGLHCRLRLRKLPLRTYAASSAEFWTFVLSITPQNDAVFSFFGCSDRRLSSSSHFWRLKRGIPGRTAQKQIPRSAELTRSERRCGRRSETATKRKTAASKEARPYRFRGGDACESNAPETFCAPHNGFEGRGGHQAPSISVFQPEPC